MSEPANDVAARAGATAHNMRTGANTPRHIIAGRLEEAADEIGRLTKELEQARRTDANVMKSLIIEIGEMLGVGWPGRPSPDGQEYISAVKALLAGQKMPNYQIVEAEAVAANSRAEAAEAARDEARAALQKARVSIATWSPDPTEPLDEIDAILAKSASWSSRKEPGE